MTVLLAKIELSNNQFIGHITLNNPSALNALSLPMVDIILPQLIAWQNDETVLAVFIDGAGDKAFCAGGDVVTMYHEMKANPDKIPLALQEFFSREYTVDYLIHSYNKPIIVWGSGIVMGGGMGLFAGASHRIVTDTTRMAMPEISIGLFPDVGGSWFLNKMPDKLGTFLGLTGAMFNGTDALFLSLANFALSAASKDALIERFKGANWQGNDPYAVVNDCCHSLEIEPSSMPDGNVEVRVEQIKSALSQEPNNIVQSILSQNWSADSWFNKAQKNLARGSMLSAAIVLEQLKRSQNLPLLECFKMELIMACRCTEFGELQEGIRALLIDKDRQPKWRYDTTLDVPEAIVNQFFLPPWSDDQHPLQEVGI